ncbi:hypothetical protein GGI20_005062 [Coemansia sp. BCRC 34301]|nr:hypothetical protein GGI20_005062 [Coemansia sp. BCRC 34301]
MDALSAFQILPQHVVKMIVDHVAGCSRLRYDHIYNSSDEYKLLEMPLLWVCRNFRAFVYSRLCRKYELNLHEGRYECKVPACLRKLSFSAHGLARDLHFEAGFRSIYTGRALQQLSAAPYEGCAFPLVRQLLVILNLDDEHTRTHGHLSSDALAVCPPEAAANTAAFVKRVKEMAPNIREVGVDFGHGADQLIEQRDVYATDLTRQLYGIVETTTAISNACISLVEYMDLAPICNLVRVDYYVDKVDSQIVPLIRRSAHTLQSLELAMPVPADLTLLFRSHGDGGGSVEYPCLRSLKLQCYYECFVSHPSVPNHMAPFPRLCRLDVRRVYPFGDDVLFRGSAATLEYLYLNLDPETVAMLRKHRVFAPASHPKLQCVNTNLRYGYAPRIFATAAEYLQFALSIAPGASAISIPNLSGFGGRLVPELELFGNHANIQALSLFQASLALWDLVGLIQSLPLLSDLQTGEPTLGKLPRGVAMAGLPEYVRSTLAPMGVRFRCWHISSVSNGKHGRLATCALLLALACPNFCYAAVYGQYREPFMQELEKQMATPMFARHAPRLRRLVFHGWRSC